MLLTPVQRAKCTCIRVHETCPWGCAGVRTLTCTGTQIKVTESGVEVGAAVTLSRMMRAFKELMASRPRHETSTLEAVVNQLRWGRSAVPSKG